MATTLLFVDADNQPSILASSLARFLRTIGRTSAKAIVAGNGMGDRVRNWESALSEALPDVEVTCHVAPLRKQSADVRLMFELAPYYHGQPDTSVLIVIFSRDDLLVAAAECLVQRGLNVMIVVGAAANGTALVTDVPVVVLATPHQVQSTAVAASASAAPLADVPVVKAENQVLATAIKTIRKSLKPNQQGGYAASAVGQVLAQLGHDKATRAKLVKQLPNLKEVGVGPEKRLIF